MVSRDSVRDSIRKIRNTPSARIHVTLNSSEFCAKIDNQAQLIFSNLETPQRATPISMNGGGRRRLAT
jgi:hypothetical protein